MCGIAGWVDWERDLRSEAEAVRRMVATLAARGPDAEGLWVSRHAVLGHRRLVVVDPEGGGQPMVCRAGDRTFVITYNGELYNTPELRRELERRGHSFRSRSDTETLLLAYVEWGPACVRRLDGIFAFAVWDEARRRLFLARDRLGVKPLFYARRGSAFLFGSELKALLAHPAVEPVVDAQGLAEVLALGPGRTPGQGVFKGIAEVRPGWSLTVTPAGLRARRYWALESRPHPHSAAETADRVRALLADAVERQLVADVPLCAFLSGGVDSSAVAALAQQSLARRGRGPLRTFAVDHAGSAHFQPNPFEPDADTGWAARVAAHLGTEHRTVTIATADLVAALEAALQARDLPGMADVDASLYLFCREVKREATVALSGEAADELFGGYPWFRDLDGPEPATFPWVRHVALRERLLAPEVAALVQPAAYLAERYREALAEVPRLPGEEGAAARARAIAYLSLTRFLPVLLDRKDRMGMAAGLEARVPFCDHRLVEYVWNIPWDIKNLDGRPKGILRRALSGLLPQAVLARPKSPYPKTHDPQYAAAVHAWARETLLDRGSPLRPLLNGDTVQRLLAGTEGLDTPFFGQLMRLPQLLAYLIQVDLWLRRYRVAIRPRGPAVTPARERRQPAHRC